MHCGICFSVLVSYPIDPLHFCATIYRIEDSIQLAITVSYGVYTNHIGLDAAMPR